MTPNQILRKTRRDREMTLAQMAETLDTSNQRVSQWEQGDPIPIERIRVWSSDVRFPDWVRSMAREMRIEHFAHLLETMGEELSELRQELVVQER